MQRRLLINLALGAVLLVLAVLAFYEPGIGEAPDLPPLTTLDPELIEHVRISDNRGRDIELARQGEGWTMLKPYRIAANTPRVQALLRIAATPVHNRFPVRQKHLDGYGLEPAAVHLSLDNERLEIGSTDPLRFRRYVRTGDSVNLIDDGFYHHLVAPAEELVTRSLLPQGARLESIQLPEYRIEHGADGGWNISPADPQVSQDRLAGRVAAWASVQALDVEVTQQPGTGTSLKFGFRGRTQPLRFIVSEGAGRLFWRSDVGLAYRLANAPELLARP